MAMVIVEKNVPMVFAMAERCVILEKRRVVAQGTRDEVSRSEGDAGIPGHLIS